MKKHNPVKIVKEYNIHILAQLKIKNKINIL